MSAATSSPYDPADLIVESYTDIGVVSRHLTAWGVRRAMAKMRKDEPFTHYYPTRSTRWWKVPRYSIRKASRRFV